MSFAFEQKSAAARDTVAGETVDRVLVGGLTNEEGAVRRGFTGCLQGLKVGDAPLSRAGAADQQNVQGGCKQADMCSFQTADCPSDSTCRDLWGQFECVCNTGGCAQGH